jgi:hypothetical protein
MRAEAPAAAARTHAESAAQGAFSVVLIVCRYRVVDNREASECHQREETTRTQPPPPHRHCLHVRLPHGREDFAHGCVASSPDDEGDAAVGGYVPLSLRQILLRIHLLLTWRPLLRPRLS